MIHDVDETLSRLLAAELARQPGCPVRDREQITFDSPPKVEAMQDGEARVNLYLYDVRGNMDRQEAGRVRVPPASAREQTVGRRHVPVLMDLAYLVTTHAGNEPLIEHRLLADTLASLLRFQAVPERYLAGVLEGAGNDRVLLTVAHPDNAQAQDLRSVWQAIGGTMRPALSLSVTVPFDPSETVWAKRVRELVRVMGPGMAPGSPRDVATLQVSVLGVVVDQEKEQPIAGVVVTPFSAEAQGGEPLAPLARTDERGFFSLRRLPPGLLRLRFQQVGYRTLEELAAVPERGRTDLLEPLVIALRPLDPEERLREHAALDEAAGSAPGIAGPDHVARAALTGRLHYPDGRPAAYAPVWIGHRRGATDVQGFYTFLDLPPGDYVVNAELPGIGVVQVNAQVPGAPGSAGKPVEALAPGEEGSAAE